MFPIKKPQESDHRKTNKSFSGYKNPHPQGTHVDIGNGVFAIMFPQDGHSPQLYVNKPEFIKKITIKVSI